MTRITVPRAVIVLIAVIGAMWLIDQLFRLVYRMADILLLFGLAWLLTLLLEPLIRRLQRAQVPRGLAIAIAYILTVGGLIGGILALTPQMSGLAQSIPSLVQEIATRAENGAIWLQQRGVEINPEALTDQIIGLGGRFGSTVAGQAVSIAQGLVSLVGRVALVITISVFMSLTAGHMSSVLRPVVPPRWRDEYDAFIQDVNTAYSSYIRGYFYIVALGTLMSGAILFGFQVSGAIIWLLVVVVLRMVPFVGGTLADLVLILAFFLQLPLPTAMLAVGLLLACQAVLTNVVMPRVMSRELGIDPLLVLFAVLLGGKIYGVAGILFAIPAAAIIATVTGKAVKRYLLPAYERPGWWSENVTIAEQTPVDVRSAEPVARPARPLSGEVRPPREATAPGIKEPL